MESYRDWVALSSIHKFPTEDAADGPGNTLLIDGCADVCDPAMGDPSKIRFLNALWRTCLGIGRLKVFYDMLGCITEDKYKTKNHKACQITRYLHNSNIGLTNVR